MACQFETKIVYARKDNRRILMRLSDLRLDLHQDMMLKQAQAHKLCRVCLLGKHYFESTNEATHTL